MNAVTEFVPAELKHDSPLGTITLEFTREFLPRFIEWCNAAKVRDDHGNVLTLGIREFTDGKAVLWASVHTLDEEK